MTQRHTYTEAADMLRCNENWLRANISWLPHEKRGREVSFTDAQLDEIGRMTTVKPAAKPSTATPSASPTADVIPLDRLTPASRSTIA